MKAGKLLHSALFILASLLCNIASAQKSVPARDTVITTDTVTKEILIPLRQRVSDEIRRNIKQLNADKIAARQNQILNSILKVSQKANDYLEKGIDTAGIGDQLDNVLRLYDVAGDGIFINKGTTQTERNLATSSTLLNELLYTTEIIKQTLDGQLKNLVSFQNNVDSLASDSVLMELPSDSVTLMNLISKVSLVTKQMRPADTLIKRAIQQVQRLQTKVNFVTIKLEDGIEQVQQYRESLSASLTDRETNNIWDQVAFRRPLNEIYSISKEKAKLVFSFYSRNNSGRVLFLLLLIVGLALYLRSLKKKIPADQLLFAGHPRWLVLRSPFLSSVLICLTIFQFIFRDPPFVFSMLPWIISVLALSIIFRGFITKFWRSAWRILVLLFFLAVIDNLTLQASRIERYGMLILSLAGVVLGTIFLVSSHRKDLKERGVRIFIGFFVLIEFIATLANLYGRYNISKSFMTSGIFGLVNAILFFWVIRLMNEVLDISAGIYKTPGKEFLISSEKPGRKVSPAFYLLLAIGWGILFGRSFYFFRQMTAEFADNMSKERTIGVYTFTIQSIFIFFTILFLSGLASNLVTFFASGDQASPGSRGRKTGIGSWVLLIRISIISVGVLLAFAAAGIPMDRLAIILGALSVGIGFGLQSLVNNLVSGLILAFEKPINVGDVVEFGGQTGTMKSIGFRSSIITTWDGANVIIPNGNLLNEQLINWTKGNSNRRVEIVAGVAHGTDLAKTKKLLLDLLAADDKILPAPQPMVLIKDLYGGVIEIRILFWIENFDSWTQIRSDMVEKIEETFKKEGIEIPNPAIGIRVAGNVPKGHS